MNNPETQLMRSVALGCQNQSRGWLGVMSLKASESFGMRTSLASQERFKYQWSKILLNHSNIEYAVNKDGSRGYAWNWLTGCANGPDICKTRDLCWAQTIAGRFHRDFTPQFHEDKFNASFPRKPGARILVCFTGDVSYARVDRRYYAARAIEAHPEHTFILLTKRPKEAYQIAMPWPSNAWLGVSLTGAETTERQKQVMDELRVVKGRHKLWLSYEPALGPLAVTLEGIDWLVIGAQGGKGAVKPEMEWMMATIEKPRPEKMWLKNNLPDSWFAGPRRQELPNG